MKPLKYLIGSGLVALVTTLSNPVFADEKPNNVPVVNVEHKYWSAADACKTYSQYQEVLINSKDDEYIKNVFHCSNGKPTGKQVETIKNSDIERYYTNGNLDLIVDYNNDGKANLTASVPMNPEERISYNLDLRRINGQLRLSAHTDCDTSRYKQDGFLSIKDQSKECSAKEWHLIYEPPMGGFPGRFYNRDTQKLTEADVKNLHELVNTVTQIAKKHNLSAILPQQKDIQNIFDMINNQLKDKK